MVEFDDLTPLDALGYKVPIHLAYMISELRCCKTVMAAIGPYIGPYKELSCTMKDGHKGECATWHPEHGIISQKPAITLSCTI